MDAQQLPVVVLDPGHGGTARVGGSSPNNAVGPNGLLEKDLTLDLATRTSALLVGRARTILTRSTDVNLSLADRAAVARSNHAELFLSIHLNGFHDPSVDGTEAWVARGASPASEGFAQEVLARLVAVTSAPNRGVRRADLGVLLRARHAPGTAACLAEIAFLTNPDQGLRLAAGAHRQQIAEALATAILTRVRVPATVGAPSTSGGGAQSLAFAAAGQGLRRDGNGHADARVLAAAIGGYGSPPPGPATLQRRPGARVFSSTYARTAAIVEPDIAYGATTLEQASQIWKDWLERYAEWRKGVPDSSLTSFPHSAVCQLRLYDAGGNLAYGTGFYIGNDTLLTCGHNFLLRAQGWETTRVEVQPGHSPVMSTFATRTFDVSAGDVIHPSWRDRADPTCDLAVLRVPGLAAPNGTFALANRSLGANEGIVVCGYGKVDGQDYESQGQRMDGAHIAEADTEMVYYPIQTVGGHSGSPVFHGSTVIGVHTGPRQSAGGAVDPLQNRAVLLNPDKIGWINQRGGTSFGQSLAANGHRSQGLGATYGQPRAYALTDESSPQAEQSLEVRRRVALSIGQAEASGRFDLVHDDSNRINFGIGSWTGSRIADVLDTYVQVADENGTTQTMYGYLGGQAAFESLRDRFRSQGAATTLSSTERAALRQLGADTSLQEAQVRRLAEDIRADLTAVGNEGNPWYPFIDGGMGAITEMAAHVLVHARHQAGPAGFRAVLRAAIDAFGGEAALGRRMVDGSVTELDFLGQVGEQVALRVRADLRDGVRRRYSTLRQNHSGSRLSYYFNPAN
jgi:N-acetylmuramoyl-L-alanine amidase/V8-like Glu-specific endopeptidase